MSMKVTQLIIAPTLSYRVPGEDNPMKCTVKLNSEETTVETVMSDEQMHEILRLVSGQVRDAAKANVDDFCRAVTAIDGGESVPMIEEKP